jgi:hypothetical protein
MLRALAALYKSRDMLPDNAAAGFGNEGAVWNARFARGEMSQ